ncbi:hypothetical protein GGQ80_001762 [Sphingomonas jinjuensis]|uniref:BLUF domain-containing protein n=1 Tax=Sphingomonas jinjuensis TaxID=535907 RepID=A0A840FC85_9SPHN|nr:hypothetical protein [Sphingomonas jinjuensis]
MIQLLYISTARGTPDISDVLAASRRNNARDDITGLLYADGVRFLQVLEGPELPVRRAFTRIAADPRHRSLVVLSDRTIDEREFGAWAMAEKRPGADADTLIARIADLTGNASPTVRATFDSFASLRRAA